MKYIILDGDPIHQITLTAKPKGMELGLKLIARQLPLFNTYSHLLHMTDIRTTITGTTQCTEDAEKHLGINCIHCTCHLNQLLHFINIQTQD